MGLFNTILATNFTNFCTLELFIHKNKYFLWRINPREWILSQSKYAPYPDNIPIPNINSHTLHNRASKFLVIKNQYSSPHLWDVLWFYNHWPAYIFRAWLVHNLGAGKRCRWRIFGDVVLCNRAIINPPKTKIKYLPEEPKPGHLWPNGFFVLIVSQKHV
jgi:hypothetical protein